MAWRETCIMDQKMCFIAACLEGEESVSSLCRHFGISRNTGHKWLSRYRAEGVGGLADRSRAPLTRPGSVDADIAAMVLSVRHRYPSWGPRKVKAWLEARHPWTAIPAASTIGGLFDGAGLTRPRKRRRRVAPSTSPLAACRAANDVWCADFKGWFLTGDGIRVDPFTLSDAHSRYLIRCQAVGRVDGAHVWPVLASAFHEHGLPRVLRTDNGPPFAGMGVAGLTRFAVKLIKAGVMPDRIEPGKPQQNGRHERMHLTLKQDTASPPASGLAEQMARFRLFQQTYNDERPHEALGQVPPATVYKPSPRAFDGVLRSPDYDTDAEVRRVRTKGGVKWRGEEIFISEALAGEPVGLFPIGDDVWLVKYGLLVLGTMKGREGFIRISPGKVDRSRERRNETRNL